MKNKEINYSKTTLNRIFICSVLILIVLVINTIILASNINPSNSTKNNDTSQTENTEYDVSKFKEVKASELVGNTKDENTVVYIGRSSCSWCVKFIPVMNEAISQYNLKPLYIDIAKIIDFSAGGIKDQASYDIIAQLDTVRGFEGYMEENFGATPMILIIKDGKIIDAQTGYSESSAFNSFLEKNGFKKK